jgi:hypothetical protein
MCIFRNPYVEIELICRLMLLLATGVKSTIYYYMYDESRHFGPRPISLLRFLILWGAFFQTFSRVDLQYQSHVLYEKSVFFFNCSDMQQSDRKSTSIMKQMVVLRQFSEVEHSKENHSTLHLRLACDVIVRCYRDAPWTVFVKKLDCVFARAHENAKNMLRYVRVQRPEVAKVNHYRPHVRFWSLTPCIRGSCLPPLSHIRHIINQQWMEGQTEMLMYYCVYQRWTAAECAAPCGLQAASYTDSLLPELKGNCIGPTGNKLIAGAQRLRVKCSGGCSRGG